MAVYPQNDSAVVNANWEAAPLPGRDAECATIRQATRRAATGSCQRVWIAGAPGSGKSAMCEWAIQDAPLFQRTAWACVEGEAEIPLGALVAVLRPLQGFADGLTLAHRQALQRLVDHGRTGDDLFGLGAAALALFAEASAHQPVMVVIDDLQWIDPASSTILSFALRRLDADAVVAVLTSRLDPIGSWLDRALEVVELSGLSEDAALTVLEEGGPIAPRVAEAVIAATGGTPLALKEVSSKLTAAQRMGAEPLPEPLPVGERLLNLYKDRIAPLDRETRLSLGVAAAAGSAHQSIPLALHAMDLSHEALSAAEEENVVRLGPTGPVFPHPLLRTASLAALSLAERRRVHAALATVCDNLEERAVHLARSSPGPTERVADELESIATTLSERQGSVIAAGAWLRAGQLSLPGPSRTIRLLRAGQELASVGRVTEAKQCLDEIIATSDDAVARADAVLVSTWMRLFTPDAAILGPEAAAEADRVLPISPTHAQRLRATAAACIFIQGQIRTALDMTPPTDPGPGVGNLPPTLETVVVPFLLCASGRHEEAAAWFPPERARTMIALARRGRNDPMSTAAMQIAASVLIWLERRDEAMELVAALIASLRKEGRPQQLPPALGVLGEALLRAGRWLEAEAVLNEASVLADQSGQPVELIFDQALLARLAAARGEARYQQLCEHVLDQARHDNFQSTEFYGLYSLGLGHLSTGRFRESVEVFDRLAEVAQRVGLESPTVLPYRADHVEALIRDGKAGRAAEVAELLQSDVDKSGSRWARAAHARVEAMLVSDENANALFEASLTALDDQPFEMARTELCWGEFLRRRRSIPESRRRLTAAASVFDRLDARPWAERARNELRASGARTPTFRRAILSQLSPQEMQVALAVGQGNSNRDTAAQLFISPKTVEYHLSSIYQKLGLRSRTELARLLPTLADSRSGEPEN